MRTHARSSRGNRAKAALEEGHEGEDVLELVVSEEDDDTDFADTDFDEEPGEVFRVRCPDCARPIALRVDDEVLPQHAVCPTWNPFGLTVCPGAGRAASEAAPADGLLAGDHRELGTLLSLPAGLDWRTQPFSHVGGPGSRPIRPARQLAA
jgi:hypothetical protein